jgi:hypothetical protein
MPQEVFVDIDEKTGDFELKLDGFKGKGCKDIAKKFESLGKVTSEQKLPAYNEEAAQTTVKTGQ